MKSTGVAEVYMQLEYVRDAMLGGSDTKDCPRSDLGYMCLFPRRKNIDIAVDSIYDSRLLLVADERLNGSSFAWHILSSL